MEDLFDRLERALAAPGALSRRHFFGRLVKSAFAVAVAVAGSAIPVSAQGCRQYACCCLAYPTNCSWCNWFRSCTSCSGGCWEWICCTECGVGCPGCTINGCNCTQCNTGGCHAYDCMECTNEGCSCGSYQGLTVPAGVAA